ncbi:MAG: lysophospholipid acyltransferase family protein [Pseudomonadota bacterium]
MHAHLKCWSLVNLWLMKYLLKIDFSMENQHNYSSSKNNIYAIKHQSALETITIFAFFDQPVIILKQEIRKIPLFGMFGENIGMIYVDRAGSTKTLKILLKKVKDAIDSGKQVIIFPEGTRTKIGQIVDYQVGIKAIYNDKNIDADIVPVALNSGQCWPKSSFVKYPGKFKLSFLEPIKKSSIDRKEFLPYLQKTIEDETNLLLEKTSE